MTKRPPSPITGIEETRDNTTLNPNIDKLCTKTEMSLFNSSNSQFRDQTDVDESTQFRFDSLVDITTKNVQILESDPIESKRVSARAVYNRIKEKLTRRILISRIKCSPKDISTSDGEEKQESVLDKTISDDEDDDNETTDVPNGKTASGLIDIMNQCEHMKGLTPPWKTEERVDRMRKITTTLNNPARALRDGSGIVQTIVNDNTVTSDSQTENTNEGNL